MSKTIYKSFDMEMLLKGGKKHLMIYGVKQMRNKEDRTEYDYIGVVYPEGNMGEGTQFLFNHDQIEEISFRGYEDEEREGFIGRLAEFYERKEGGN